MARRPRRLSPEDGPLAVFALDLRALRDNGGPTAPSPEEISAKEGIHRTTIYAALAGKRVPNRDVLAAMVKHWGGDQAEWTFKRSALENVLGTVQQVRNQERSAPEPARFERGGVTWGELKSAGITWNDLSEVDRSRPVPSESDRAQFAEDLNALRESQGLTIRQVARRTDMAASSVGDWLSGRSLPRLDNLVALVSAITQRDHAEVDRWKERWLRLRTQ